MLYDPRRGLDDIGRVMLDAAALIRERGHCKYVVERDGRVCLLGAIATVMTGSADGFHQHRVTGRVIEMINPFPNEFYARMHHHLGGVDPVEWNNAPERTGEEVAAALEAAAPG